MADQQQLLNATSPAPDGAKENWDFFTRAVNFRVEGPS